MTLVNDWLVQITQTDTLMVLVDPVLNKMSGLSTMSLSTCRDVEHTNPLKACSSLSRKPEYLYRSPGIVLGQHSVNVSEGHTNKG